MTGTGTSTAMEEHRISAKAILSGKEEYEYINGELNRVDVYVEAVNDRHTIKCACGKTFGNLDEAEAHMEEVDDER